MMTQEIMLERRAVGASEKELPAPADSAARERAIDTKESIIVQAPAGSGKTELLSQRVLALLAEVEEPEQIVALTFTRKAAREMRERITAALIEAQGPEPVPAHKRKTWELAARALANDRRREWHLLSHPSRLRVTTIDSLCSMIARRMPVLSGFGALPDVNDDATQIYASAARAFVATLEEDHRWSAALARLLRHLDNDIRRVEGLIVSMLRRRDQWLRHVGRLGRIEDDLDAVRHELEMPLLRAVAEAVVRARASFPADDLDEVIALGRFAAENVDEGPIAALRDLSDLTADEGCLDAWHGVRTLLLTGSGDWRKPGGINVNLGFPARHPMKDRMKHLLVRLSDGGHEDVHDALSALDNLPTPRYSESQWEVIRALIEVLKAADGFLQTQFQIEEACDFSAVSLAARAALDDGDGPTELAVSLDAEIRHLLIDEFQDTSNGQFALLERLIREWQPGDGRTLFLVGDPMQSIYRFREAEVGLFLQAWNHGVGPIRLTPVKLTVNFRSLPCIVDWVNDTFGAVFPAADDIASGAISYAPSVAGRAGDQASGPSGVAVHAYVGSNVERETEDLLAIVEREREESPDSSVAVLVRSRGALVEIVPELRRRGIAFQAVEIDRLGDLPAIVDVRALTRALLHPADRIAWLALLRAPWCGLSLGDLHVVAGSNSRETVWQLVGADGLRERMSADGWTRLERFRQAMQPVMSSPRGDRLRRTVQGCWLALGGPACCSSDAELRDVHRFFDVLDQYEKGGDIEDLEGLERAVAELRASPDTSQDRLQIMTIHKSKGLQFDVVLLPGLQRAQRSDEPSLLLFAEVPRIDGTDLLVAPIKAVDSDGDPVYRWLSTIERRKDVEEEKRLLYVAITRARRSVHLFGSVAENALERGPSGCLLRHLYPVIADEFLRAAELVEPSAEETLEPPAEQRQQRALRRLAAPWSLPEAPADVEWKPLLDEPERDRRMLTNWAESTTRHVGTVAHDLLCTIARQGIATWTAERLARQRGRIESDLRSLGVSGDAMAKAVDRVIEAVEATLADERGAWILDPSHTFASDEFPLTGYVDGELRSIRVDRTFVDADGVRWVIDYKIPHHAGGDVEAFLDRERERYREQLRCYAELLNGYDPDHDIRCGLYFPGLGWRELV